MTTLKETFRNLFSGRSRAAPQPEAKEKASAPTPRQLTEALLEETDQPHPDPQKIRDLVARGADVNAKDSDGWAPLHHAVALGRAAVAEVLLKAGADVKAVNKFGETSLHYAAHWNRAAISEALLNADADAKAATHDGWTSLHYAAQMGHDATAEILLRAGADPEILNKNNQTAHDVARENGHDATARLLDPAILAARRAAALEAITAPLRDGLPYDIPAMPLRIVKKKGPGHGA